MPDEGATPDDTAHRDEHDAMTIGPPWLPTTLVVIATILAIVGSLTTWVRTQALDTDEWVEVSSELLLDEDVQEALSAYLVAELFSQVDVADELASALPDQLAGLAAPLAGALRAPATDAVEQLVGSPRFNLAWAESNRRAHQALVAVLQGESTALSTDDGTITLELRNVVVAVGEDLGVSSDTLDRIPEDAGQVVLFESDALAEAQQAVRVTEFLSWFLYVLVVGLFAAAIILARGRRREVLRQVGIGLLVAGVTVLLGRAIGIRTTVDVLVTDAARANLAVVVGQISTQLLGQIGAALAVYGALFIGFAALLGQHRWAVATRRTLARWADSTGAIVVVAVALLAGLWWWSPGAAFSHWVTALVLVGLVLGAVAMLVSRIRQEFPAASPGVDGATTVPSAGVVSQSATDDG